MRKLSYEFKNSSDFLIYLCTYLGKNLEHGLKKQGLLTFMRELDGNDNESIDNYLRDASMYARGILQNP